MNTPEPLTEQNVLHNQMINADKSDLATLRDIVWKLRKLDRKLGNDFSTRMSLQIGLMAIGEREEADSLTESLFGSLSKAEPHRYCDVCWIPRGFAPPRRSTLGH